PPTSLPARSRPRARPGTGRVPAPKRPPRAEPVPAPRRSQSVRSGPTPAFRACPQACPSSARPSTATIPLGDTSDQARVLTGDTEGHGRERGRPHQTFHKESAVTTTTTYLGSGDVSTHRRDYRPEWLDNLADDVTMEGSVLNGIA